MTQNENDNLFNFDQPPSEQPPRQEQPETPQQPFSAGEPEGAQVYSTPPAYQPVEPPLYTPPPPAKSNNNRVWIIAIVVILLLCCCCLVLAGVWLWNNGDQYLEEFSSLAPALYQALA